MGSQRSRVEKLETASSITGVHVLFRGCDETDDQIGGRIKREQAERGSGTQLIVVRWQTGAGGSAA